MKDIVVVYMRHDLAKVKSLDFLIFNLDKLGRTRALKKIFIMVYSSQDSTTDEEFRAEYKRVEDQLYHCLRIKPVVFKKQEDMKNEILIITNAADYDGIRDMVLAQNGTIIWLDSDTLFPRSFMIDCVNPLIKDEERILGQDINISLPVMHYKYRFKTVVYNNKEHVVKDFLKTRDPFYLEHHIKQISSDDEVPDWDERFYITHHILEKTDGSMPIVSPSPLLHNWGATKLFIQNDSKSKAMIFPNSRMVLHKFEEIFEGEE